MCINFKVIYVCIIKFYIVHWPSFLILKKMDGENLKSKFKTFIDKTKNSTRTSNLDNGGSQEIMSSDNIALAAAERSVKVEIISLIAKNQ